MKKLLLITLIFAVGCGSKKDDPKPAKQEYPGAYSVQTNDTKVTFSLTMSGSTIGIYSAVISGHAVEAELVQEGSKIKSIKITDTVTDVVITMNNVDFKGSLLVAATLTETRPGEPVYNASNVTLVKIG